MLDFLLSFLRCPAELSRAKAERQTAITAWQASEELLKQCRQAYGECSEKLLAQLNENGDLRRRLNAFETADLVNIIGILGPKAIWGMDEAAYGRVWWQCLEALRLLFTHPVPTVETTYDQIVDILKDEYPGLFMGGRTDTKYYMARRQADLIRMVESTWVRWVPSKEDVWDCDDFTAAFDLQLALAGVNAKAVVFGTIPGATHEFGLIPSSDGLLMVDCTSMQRYAPCPPGIPGYVPVQVMRL